LEVPNDRPAAQLDDLGPVDGLALSPDGRRPAAGQRPVFDGKAVGDLDHQLGVDPVAARGECRRDVHEPRPEAVGQWSSR
jgi:hypothetical protein